MYIWPFPSSRSTVHLFGKSQKLQRTSILVRRKRCSMQCYEGQHCHSRVYMHKRSRLSTFNKAGDIGVGRAIYFPIAFTFLRFIYHQRQLIWPSCQSYVLTPITTYDNLIGKNQLCASETIVLMHNLGRLMQ